jgi:hypothetical protein
VAELGSAGTRVAAAAAAAVAAVAIVAVSAPRAAVAQSSGWAGCRRRQRSPRWRAGRVSLSSATAIRLVGRGGNTCVQEGGTDPMWMVE